MLMLWLVRLRTVTAFQQSNWAGCHERNDNLGAEHFEWHAVVERCNKVSGKGARTMTQRGQASSCLAAFLMVGMWSVDSAPGAKLAQAV